MKKKKLETKLSKTKKKLSAARMELDAMLGIMEKSGMPKASEPPAAGAPVKPKTAAAKPKAKTAVKPVAAAKPKAKPAAKPAAPKAAPAKKK